jgi:hypothetical protein
MSVEMIRDHSAHFFCDYIYSLSLKFIKLHNRQPGNTDIELIATFHKEGRLGPIKLSHS